MQAGPNKPLEHHDHFFVFVFIFVFVFVFVFVCVFVFVFVFEFLFVFVFVFLTTTKKLELTVQGGWFHGSPSICIGNCFFVLKYLDWKLLFCHEISKLEIAFLS